MSRSKTLALLAAALLVAGAPLACRKKSATKGTEGEKQASGKKVLYWYDPMKPEVHFDHPGKSPFMDMRLEPKYAEEQPAAGAAAPPRLSVARIPLERRQESAVTTAQVAIRALGRPFATTSRGVALYTSAGLSTVWLLADVSQSEMPIAAPGNAAEVSVPFLPGESLRGRIDFVYPTLTEDTRTVKARLVIPNPKGLLKPGMFVRVSVSGKGREALAIPRSALLQTGERQIAFV